MVASVVLGAALATALATALASAAALPNGGSAPLWSPDGRWLAFVSATPNSPVNLWVAPASGRGGSPCQLTRLGARSLGWAPDSRALYCQTYRSGRAGYYAAGLNGAPEQAVLSFLGERVTTVVPSADGRRVAFVRRGDSGRDLWIADWDGRNEHRLTEKLPVRTPAWNPDGARLAFDVGGVYGEATYVVDAAGGEPRLVFGGVGSFPSWSPDGKQLVVLGLHAATLVGADGQENRRLHISQEDRSPLSWSPDGTRLVYTAVEGAARAIATVEVASGKTQVLSSGWTQAGSPRWSPDGRFLAFDAAAAGAAARNIYVLDVRTRRPHPITVSSPSTWSARRAGGQPGLLSLSNLLGPGDVRLCRSDPRLGRQVPLLAIAPDLPLQFSWPRASACGVVANGDTVWLLTNPAAPRELLKTQHPTSADLSPTGDRLAYVRWQEHKPSLVVRQLADGTEEALLGPPGGNQAYGKLAWSPRGSDIAFVRGSALCRLRLDRRTVSVLWDATGGGEGIALLPPVWSPDGRRLVCGRFIPGKGAAAGAGDGAAATDGPRLETWVIGAAGGRPTLVATSAITAEHGLYADPLAVPYAWAPDGRRLAVGGELAGSPALYVVRIGRGQPEPELLRRAAAYPEWSADGGGIGYTDLSDNREALRWLRIIGDRDRQRDRGGPLGREGRGP
jgi:Tol biopolymer transport system component